MAARPRRVAHALAEQGDGPLAVLVDVHERASLGGGPARATHGDVELREPTSAAPTRIVLGQRSQEQTVAGQPGELRGRDGAPASRLLPAFARAHNVARRWNVIDAHEFNPVHMPDDGDTRDGSRRADQRLVEARHCHGPFGIYIVP